MWPCVARHGRPPSAKTVIKTFSGIALFHAMPIKYDLDALGKKGGRQAGYQFSGPLIYRKDQTLQGDKLG